MLRLLLILCSLLLACEERAPSAGDPGGAPAPAPRPQVEADTRTEAPPALSPGRHETRGKTAYAFAPGMSRVEVKAIIDAAIRDGHMTLAEERHETRSSYQVKDMPVHIYVLDIQREQPEQSIGLTLFNDQLVGVRVVYDERDARRAIAPAKEHGPPQHSTAWIGWWLRDEQLIIQNRNDGSAREVLDLAIARRHMPDIDRKALEAWLSRYKEPPPWMAEIVEAQEKAAPSQGP